MTAHEILGKVRSEIETSLERLNQLRVHDDRVRGQLEALRHIGTVLTNLGAEQDVEPPAAPPMRLPDPYVKKAAPPVKAARPRSHKRMAR